MGANDNNIVRVDMTSDALAVVLFDSGRPAPVEVDALNPANWTPTGWSVGGVVKNSTYVYTLIADDTLTGNYSYTVDSSAIGTVAGGNCNDPATSTFLGYRPPQTTVNLWGFGDTTEYRDTYGDASTEAGFGDPRSIVAVTIDEELRTQPDNGAVKITLTGDWPIRGGDASGYMVSFVDAGLNEYPCYGCVPGYGYRAQTDRARQRLSFISPPVATGTYDIKIQFYDGGLQTITIADIIEVVYRNRRIELYALRQRFPMPPYNTGRARIDEEPLLI